MLVLGEPSRLILCNPTLGLPDFIARVWKQAAKQEQERRRNKRRQEGRCEARKRQLVGISIGNPNTDPQQHRRKGLTTKLTGRVAVDYLSR